MNRVSAIAILSAVAVTAASIVIWQATGGDWYTKFEVVEQIESMPDPDDPLAAAGFYEEGTVTRTVVRDEFRLGLLPTPAGLFDKHALSVVTLSGPPWLIAVCVVWYQRCRAKTLRTKR